MLVNTPHSALDANLAVALDALLTEQSVTRAAPSHLAAMTLAVRSDVVCLVPAAFPGNPETPLTHTATALGLRLLDIPLPLPPLTIGMAWHPRHAADTAHHWLRDAVRRTLHAPAAG
jgi:DNA-binding transcriptional LysR family regulator